VHATPASRDLDNLVCAAHGVVHRPRTSVLLAEAAAATDEQKASGISWDSHEYVEKAPDTLVRDDDMSGANMDMRRRFEENCRRAQNNICNAVSELDGTPFKEDVWTRPGGGGGISRVLSNGNVFEKAGCSLSVVYGSCRRTLCSRQHRAAPTVRRAMPRASACLSLRAACPA